MSLRVLIALLLIILLALSGGFLYFISPYLHISWEQMVYVGIGEAVIALLAFLLISLLVAGPLRKLSRAIANFGEDFSVNLPRFSSLIPSEVRSISASFQTFSSTVSEAHKKDQEVSRVKSDFISTVAHQLRTPLTGIRWSLEALQQENLTSEQKQIVESALVKSHDLVTIVATLLDISSMESGKYTYHFADFDMSALLAEVAQDFAALAQASQITLFYAKEGPALPHVYGDRDRLKWVLNNLVENAIRYTPAEGNVRLSADATALRVNVRVTDSGIGIREEDRGNIFERFYRGENARAKDNQGNGLGLYIARTIATDHQGDLNFVPNPEGRGTMFVLSLPVANALAPKEI